MLYCVCINPQDYYFGIYELTISTAFIQCHQNFLRVPRTPEMPS